MISVLLYWLPDAQRQMRVPSGCGKQTVAAEAAIVVGGGGGAWLVVVAEML